MSQKFKITLVALTDGEDNGSEEFLRSFIGDNVEVQDGIGSITFKVFMGERSAERPVPMLLVCPDPRCGARHIDEGEFTTKVHHTHACQCCGMVWRPALVPTVGVQFLPGFKNEEPT